MKLVVRMIQCENKIDERPHVTKRELVTIDIDPTVNSIAKRFFSNALSDGRVPKVIFNGDDWSCDPIQNFAFQRFIGEDGNVHQEDADIPTILFSGPHPEGPSGGGGVE